jgi:hypothetical protein
MTTADSRRIEARSRRLAAVHEAGHLVIAAHHLGIVPLDTRIWRDADGSWNGYTEREGWPRPGSRQRRLIAVAGVVAEAAWLGAEDATEVKAILMNASDWEPLRLPGDLRGGAILLRTLHEVFQLLRRGGPLWPILVREARKLLIKARAG